MSSPAAFRNPSAPLPCSTALVSRANVPYAFADNGTEAALPSLADCLAERLQILKRRHREAIAAAQARAAAFERLALARATPT